MLYDSTRLRLIFICLVALLLSIAVTPGRAQTIADADGNGHLPAQVVTGVDPADNTRYTWTVSLAPDPAVTGIVLVRLSVAEWDLLTTKFPTWTFTLAGLTAPGDFPGALNVVRYDPVVGLPWNPPDSVGVWYTPAIGFALPAGFHFQWIQFVTTNCPTPTGPGTPRPNAPGTAVGQPYIDPYDYDWDTINGVSYGGLCDGTPFYWMEGAEIAANSAGGAGMPVGVAIRFTDRPWRYLSQAQVAAPVQWEAHLYLVAYNPGPPAQVIIDNTRGICWGFTIVRVRGGRQPPAGPQKDRGGAGGDKFDGGWGTPINGTLHMAVVESFSACENKEEDSFGKYASVYVHGSWYAPNTTYPIYVVENTAWAEGMPIPAPVPGTAATIRSNGTGQIPPTIIWSPAVAGAYDIIVDVNHDGFYNATIDALDDNDLNGAGFIVTQLPVGGYSVPANKLKPNLSSPYIGLASTIIVATAATAIYVKRVKRRKEKQ